MNSNDSEYAPVKLPQVEKTAYTDSDLKKTLGEHKWGVIYIWSPYMPLSVKAIREIKAAVKNKGGHVTILLDGKASLDEAKKWMKKEKLNMEELTQVGAYELYERDITLHYPITLIYADGFLSNRSYVGHKSSKIFEKWIEIELAEIKKDMTQ